MSFLVLFFSFPLSLSDSIRPAWQGSKFPVWFSYTYISLFHTRAFLPFRSSLCFQRYLFSSYSHRYRNVRLWLLPTFKEIKDIVFFFCSFRCCCLLSGSVISLSLSDLVGLETPPGHWTVHCTPVTSCLGPSGTQIQNESMKGVNKTEVKDRQTHISGRAGVQCRTRLVSVSKGPVLIDCEQLDD